MALSFYKLGGERDMQGSEEARRGADVRRWTQCRWEAAADSLQLLSTGTLPRALMQAAIHGHSLTHAGRAAPIAFTQGTSAAPRGKELKRACTMMCNTYAQVWKWVEDDECVCSTLGWCTCPSSAAFPIALHVLVC